MNQARRRWARISPGGSFFDVISAVRAADKSRRPLLTAAAPENKGAPFSEADAPESSWLD